MADDLLNAVHNPDVLSCLANLSNDEVFTPPNIVNQMLDLLPQDLFSNPKTTFLDPACKTGVYLREIAKRLLVGLEPKIPDLQARIDHIFHKQLFGIAITELTGLVARRSVYCSKYPNGKYSVTQFNDAMGNIRYRKIKHRWVGGKCNYCGVSQVTQLGDRERGETLETHAYEWIHTLKPEEIFNMKFDVIISNPPYQLNDGGNNASARPIYQLFVQQAIKLRPRFLSMVIPSRWFSGGKGLDEFRHEMLHDKRVRQIVDYFDSKECFPGVDISGGVCYFLWNRDQNGDCDITSYRNQKKSTMTRSLLETSDDTFIRFNEAVSIVRKVKSLQQQSFSLAISSRKPFGLDTNVLVGKSKTPKSITIYAYPENGYVLTEKVTQNREWIKKNKVCISYAYGERGNFPYLVIGKPFIAEPNSCCSETYLIVFTTDNIAEAKNVISYMVTKFFRFLVLLKKNTQHATKTVYKLVPMQDFSKPWTDEELYKKYKLSQEEIAFIESMIRPMDLTGGATDGD